MHSNLMLINKCEMIVLKSKEEIKWLRESGRITAMTLNKLRESIHEGMKTMELDKIAENEIRQLGGIPAFKGYGRNHRSKFPSSITVSVNEEVVHGIPGQRKINSGDIVGIDIGVIYNGFYSDAAMTVIVGKVPEKTLHLVSTTEEALYKGIEKAVSGGHLYDISQAIQNYAESNGYSVVKTLYGHGIGRNLHEEPTIPNYGKAGFGPKLEVGMVFALEPMLNMGKSEVMEKDDNWTVVTVDGSLSAHFEHTIAITENGTQILTMP